MATAGRDRTAAYPLLLALGALHATGYSVIVPVAPAISDATGAGPATIGLLVAALPAGMVAEQLSQAQIGALYVGASLVVAAGATASGGAPPRPLVFASVLPGRLPPRGTG